MKKTLSIVTDAIRFFVLLVGWWTIYDFCSTRQPASTKIALIIFFVITGCTFVWMTTISPFFQGLREEPPEFAKFAPTEKKKIGA